MGLGLRGLQGPGGIGGPGSPGRPYSVPTQGGLSMAASASGGGLGRGPTGSGGGGGMSVGSGLNYAGKAANLAGYDGAGSALGLASGLYGLSQGKDPSFSSTYSMMQAAQNLAAAGGYTAAGTGAAGAGTAAAGAGAGTAAGTGAAALGAGAFMGPLAAVMAYGAARDATEQKNFYKGAQNTYDRLIGMGVEPTELDPRQMFNVVDNSGAQAFTGGEGSDSSLSGRSRPTAEMNEPFWNYLRKKYPEIDQKIGMHDLAGDFTGAYSQGLVNKSPELQAWADYQNTVHDNSGGG